MTRAGLHNYRNEYRMTRTLILAADHAAQAGERLIADTCLAWSPALQRLHTQDVAGSPFLKVTIAEPWGWSSGEEALVGLLAALSTERAPFDVTDLYRVDVQTRRVAYEAVGVALGLVPVPVGVSS